MGKLLSYCLGNRRQQFFAAAIVSSAFVLYLCPSDTVGAGQPFRDTDGQVGGAVAPDAIQDDATRDAQRLKMHAEIISQKYCRNDNKTYTVVFSLRMHFVNEADKKLIVDRNVGHGLYNILIASDAKNLSGGKYEYETNYEWGTTSQGPPETQHQFESPGPAFAVLAPGDSLQSKSEFWAAGAGRLNATDEYRRTRSPGSHVLEVTITTWEYKAKPEEVRKRWEPIGNLISDSVKSEPLAFVLPSDPKIDNCGLIR